MKTKGVFKYSGFAVFLLLCATLFTLLQVNDARSKYSAGANSTSNATVAKWDVSIAPVTQTHAFNMVAGNTEPVEYTVRVTSNSQVSSTYSIIVSNVPNNVKVSLDNGTAQIPTNNTVTFENAGTIDIGSANTYNDHKIKFDAPIDADVANNNVDIQVVFTQKD